MTVVPMHSAGAIQSIQTLQFIYIYVCSLKTSYEIVIINPLSLCLVWNLSLKNLECIISIYTNNFCSLKYGLWYISVL